MTENVKKKPLLLSSEAGTSDKLPTTEPKQRKTVVHRKPIRRINPMGMRVVVNIKRDASLSEGGLYLPEGAKQAMSESVLAEVTEVASAVDHHTDEEANISGIPLGALVLIPKTAGVKVPWDEFLRIVEVKEILAVINEIEYV